MLSFYFFYRLSLALWSPSHKSSGNQSPQRKKQKPNSRGFLDNTENLTGPTKFSSGGSRRILHCSDTDFVGKRTISAYVGNSIR